MRWQDVLESLYRRRSEELVKAVGSLTVGELKKRPAPGANPVGWLAWHVSRSMDRFLGDIVLGEQFWLKDGWHKKFRRDPDPHDTGMGHTDEQVDALYIPDGETLLAYHAAVSGPLFRYLHDLTEGELDRPHASLLYPPGETRPVYTRITPTDFLHVGQMHYARGIVKGHRWTGN
jgi:hypothetical protein